jgi:CBS domain containing-hemolysin-like protein
MDPDLVLIIVLVVAFGLAIFLAAAETAFIRVPAVRVRALAAEGSTRASQVSRLIERLPEVLNAILLAALLSQIVAATVAGVLAGRRLGSTGPAIASAVLTFVLYVYAEAIPKTYAVRHPTRVVLAVALPLAAIEWVLRPIVKILIWIADLQMPGRGVVTGPTVTEDELRLLASKAAIEGEITSDDAELIERVFRVGDLEVDDIMIPRPDVVGVEESASVATAVDVGLEAGHRRLAVYRDSIEHIAGVVRLRDLVRIPESRRGDLRVGSLATEPLVVPETKRVLDLLQEMQAGGVHLAVVVDEYGGTAGIVTVEDIAEELLGSITDEPSGGDLVELPGGGWRVNGTLPVEDLAELIGADLDDTEWNTVAGLVLALAGHIPAVGFETEFEDHVFRVVGTRGRRITRIEVRPGGPSDGAD